MDILEAMVFPLRRTFLAVPALALAAIALGLYAHRAEGSARDARSTVVNIYTTLGYQGSAAAGTGIVIGSSGLVLTNNHVIRGSTQVRVTVVGNGRTYKAKVLGYSVGSDVALLQLSNASGLQTAPIGGSVSVGQAVTALGNAGGSGRTIPAPGRVTATGRSITANDDEGGSERLTGLIATDAALQPGDSGGPLVDSAGRVIGMDTAGSTSFQFQQTSTKGYAIPIAKALAVAKQIQTGQASATVHIGPTAMLGVSIQPSDGYGALVTSVVSGSPAESAGIVPGVLITALGGKRISTLADLSSVMLRHKPNDNVAVTWQDEYGSGLRATIRLASGPPQ